MNTDHVAHALVDSYVFQKAIAHSDYEAMAREIAVMLDAAEAAAYERAAQAVELECIQRNKKWLGVPLAAAIRKLK